MPPPREASILPIVFHTFFLTVLQGTFPILLFLFLFFMILSTSHHYNLCCVYCPLPPTPPEYKLYYTGHRVSDSSLFYSLPCPLPLDLCLEHGSTQVFVQWMDRWMDDEF